MYVKVCAPLPDHFAICAKNTSQISNNFLPEGQSHSKINRQSSARANQESDRPQAGQRGQVFW